MVTYESLKELAQTLSKITGYRYIAFCESYRGDLFIYFSDSEMSWHERKMFPFGDWANELDCGVLPIKDLPFLDWSKCQFDCKEANNEEED